MHGLQRDSTLDQWLRWLETLHPKKIDLSLNRIRTVLEALELDRPPYRVITVGGTNGKGSCVAFLTSIYRHAGYRVGAFTSPHLIKFNERIEVDGIYASDQQLVDAFVEMEQARGKVTLSYFEASAVAAVIHFARCEVDIAVLEVGMGGRLDAVNALDADGSLIVSIGLDHEEWLGDDLESIGFEKAGIMRPGRPAVIAETKPPRTLRSAAQESGADAYFAGADYHYSVDTEHVVVVCRSGIEVAVPIPRFGGQEQHSNVAACVQLVTALADKLPIAEAAFISGVAATRPRGRMQSQTIGGVEWIFDVAHNPDAAQRFAEHLRRHPVSGRCFALFGAMRDKDLAGVLGYFAAIVDEWYLVPVESERGATVADIQANLVSIESSRITAFANVPAACAAAKANAQDGDRVIVFGSFYTVGPALSALAIYFDAPSGAV